MDGQRFTEVLQRLIGEEATQHCIRKVGGGLDKPFHEDLFGYEALAFYVYSNASTWHVTINRALRNQTKDPDILAFAEVLDGGLLKIPPLRGKASEVFRGLNVPDLDTFVEGYSVGSEIIFRGFTSASYAETGAFGGNVLFIIRANSARSVWYLAAHFQEEEALLPTGCQFRVISTARRGNRLVIVLEELGGR